MPPGRMTKTRPWTCGLAGNRKATGGNEPKIGPATGLIVTLPQGRNAVGLNWRPYSNMEYVINITRYLPLHDRVA